MASVQESAALDEDTVPAQPTTASYFRVEDSIVTNGIRLDIRQFAWQQSCTGRHDSKHYYLDLSLQPRAEGARFYSGVKMMPRFGDVFFLPKGVSFDAVCEPSEYRVLSLTFDGPAAARLFDREEVTVAPPPCFDLQLPVVRQGLARLADELRNPGFGQDVLVEGIAMSLVVDVCRHLQSRAALEDSSTVRMADWRLKRLKDRIQATLDAPLSISELADECGISARHLMRTFKNTVGTTISNYVAEARIEQAKQELLREGALIKVVAGNCGFQSPAAFSAAFRRATGFSPRNYREEAIRARA